MISNDRSSLSITQKNRNPATYRGAPLWCSTRSRVGVRLGIRKTFVQVFDGCGSRHVDVVDDESADSAPGDIFRMSLVSDIEHEVPELANVRDERKLREKLRSARGYLARGNFAGDRWERAVTCVDQIFTRRFVPLATSLQCWSELEDGYEMKYACTSTVARDEAQSVRLRRIAQIELAVRGTDDPDGHKTPLLDGKNAFIIIQPSK